MKFLGYISCIIDNAAIILRKLFVTEPMQLASGSVPGNKLWAAHLGSHPFSDSD